MKKLLKRIVQGIQFRIKNNFVRKTTVDLAIISQCLDHIEDLGDYSRVATRLEEVRSRAITLSQFRMLISIDRRMDIILSMITC